jgi:hypothetical protein
VALLEQRMAMVETETTLYLAPLHQPGVGAALVIYHCREMQTETTAALAAAVHINLLPAPDFLTLMPLEEPATLPMFPHHKAAMAALEKVLLLTLAAVVVVARPLLERLEQLRLAVMAAAALHPPLAGAA